MLLSCDFVFQKPSFGMPLAPGGFPSTNPSAAHRPHQHNHKITRTLRRQAKSQSGSRLHKTGRIPMMTVLGWAIPNSRVRCRKKEIAGCQLETTHVKVIGASCVISPFHTIYTNDSPHIHDLGAPSWVVYGSVPLWVPLGAGLACWVCGCCWLALSWGGLSPFLGLSFLGFPSPSDLPLADEREMGLVFAGSAASGIKAIHPQQPQNGCLPNQTWVRKTTEFSLDAGCRRGKVDGI